MNTESQLEKANGRVAAQTERIALLEGRLKDRDELIRKQVVTIKKLIGGAMMM